MNSMATERLKSSFSQFSLTKEQSTFVAKRFNETKIDLDDLKDDEKRTFSSSEALVNYGILEELLSFYNNDLCFSFFQYASCSDQEEPLRKRLYYFENYLLRYCAALNYLGQAISGVLYLNLTTNKVAAEARDEALNYDFYGKRIEDTYKFFGREVDSNEHDKRVRNRKKDEPLLNISPKKSKNSVLKRLKERREIDKNLRIVVNAFECEITQNYLALRNTVAHSSSLASRLHYDAPMKGAAALPSYYYNNSRDFSYLKSADESFELISSAFRVFCMMLYNQSYPNRIENAGKEYYVFGVKCEKCDKEFTMPADFALENETITLCPYCKRDTTVNPDKKMKTSNDLADEIWLKYLDLLVDGADE